MRCGVCFRFSLVAEGAVDGEGACACDCGCQGTALPGQLYEAGDRPLSELELLRRSLGAFFGAEPMLEVDERLLEILRQLHGGSQSASAVSRHLMLQANELCLELLPLIFGIELGQMKAHPDLVAQLRQRANVYVLIVLFVLHAAS